MKNMLQCRTSGCVAVFGRWDGDDLHFEVQAGLLGDDKFRCVVFNDGRVVIQCPDCCRLNTFVRGQERDHNLELVEKVEKTGAEDPSPWTYL